MQSTGSMADIMAEKNGDNPVESKETKNTQSSEKESLVIASKTRAYIKDCGCMVSPEALEEFNRRVYELLDKAIHRTKENKRTTLRPHDF